MGVLRTVLFLLYRTVNKCIRMWFCVLFPVLRIHDILVRIQIQIRIRGSILLTNGSGFGSCYFRHLPSRRLLHKFLCSLFFEGTFTSFFRDKKSKRSHKTVGIKVFRTIRKYGNTEIRWCRLLRCRRCFACPWTPGQWTPRCCARAGRAVAAFRSSRPTTLSG